MKGKELTLKVPAGLGDLWWIQQKLLDCEIHWRVQVTQMNEIAKRSEEWLKLFPSTKSVKFEVVSLEETKVLFGGDFSLKASIEPQDYCLNNQLEHGFGLESLEPRGARKFRLESVAPKENEEYDVFYVSHGALTMPKNVREKTKCWTLEQWEEFIDGYKMLFGHRKTYVIGASFDYVAMEVIGKCFPNVVLWVNRAPKEVVGLLEGCRRFVGYQSGLNVVAESMNVEQVMLYFAHLDKLHWSWILNTTDKYKPYSFGESPSNILQKLS